MTFKILVLSAIDEVRFAVYADRKMIEKKPQRVCRNLLALLLGDLHGIVLPVNECDASSAKEARAFKVVFFVYV